MPSFAYLLLLMTLGDVSGHPALLSELVAQLTAKLASGDDPLHMLGTVAVFFMIFYLPLACVWYLADLIPVRFTEVLCRKALKWTVGPTDRQLFESRFPHIGQLQSLLDALSRRGDIDEELLSIRQQLHRDSSKRQRLLFQVLQRRTLDPTHDRYLEFRRLETRIAVTAGLVWAGVAGCVTALYAGFARRPEERMVIPLAAVMATLGVSLLLAAVAGRRLPKLRWRYAGEVYRDYAAMIEKHWKRDQRGCGPTVHGE